MNWATIIVSAITALLTGGAGVAIINAISSRRQRNAAARVKDADASGRLSDSALKWVEQFQEEARSARQETAEARRELADMRREVASIRGDAEQLGRELRSIRALILSPSVTLEQLRAAVGGANGRTP